MLSFGRHLRYWLRFWLWLRFLLLWFLLWLRFWLRFQRWFWILLDKFWLGVMVTPGLQYLDSFQK